MRSRDPRFVQDRGHAAPRVLPRARHLLGFRQALLRRFLSLLLGLDLTLESRLVQFLVTRQRDRAEQLVELRFRARYFGVGFLDSCSAAVLNPSRSKTNAGISSSKSADALSARMRSRIADSSSSASAGGCFAPAAVVPRQRLRIRPPVRDAVRVDALFVLHLAHITPVVFRAAVSAHRPQGRPATRLALLIARGGAPPFHFRFYRAEELHVHQRRPSGLHPLARRPSVDVLVRELVLADQARFTNRFRTCRCPSMPP